MAEIPFTRTIGDWEAEFRRARSRRAFTVSAPQLERCRQKLREISVLTRRHRREARLERAEYAALLALSYDGLLFTRLAHQELTQLDQPGAETVPVELLERLLAETQSRLQTIDAQLQLIDDTITLAEMLRPIIEGILSEDGYPARRLEPLLQRLDPRKFRGSAQQLVPWPGVSFEHILEQAGWPQPWFYAQAIHSARWMAATHGGLAEDDAYPCVNLIAAALLADLGLLMMSQNHPGLPFRKDPRALAAFRRHPDISAAIVSGIGGASSEWALLAGQHHERIDGSGFPNRCSDRQLSPAARGFAAGLRFSELLLCRSANVVRATDTLAISAAALWRETESGAFDARLVTRMLAAVSPTGTAAPSRDDIPTQTPLHDPAHPLAGPHYRVGVVTVDEQHSQVTVGPPSPQYLRHHHRHAHRKTWLQSK